VSKRLIIMIWNMGNPLDGYRIVQGGPQ